MPAEETLDLLSEGIDEVLYRSKHGKLLKRLAKETNWNQREVETMAMLHRKIVAARGPCTRYTFRDVAHSGMDFTENIRHLLIDRIFSQIDKRNTLRLSNESFITGMDPVLKGNLSERADFAYKVYDLMRTNKLTKEQMFPMLRGCFIKMSPEESPDENVRDMVELLVKSIDQDRDGDVSSEEFKLAVMTKNSLFLECMGPVFPSREAKHALLTTLTDKISTF